jgi:hypothetical protein
MTSAAVVLPAVVKPEVPANRERLLLDLGLLFDLQRTLRLALDPLGTRRSRACRFALRAPVLSLAVRATGAHRAVLFQLPVRVGVAYRALAFPLLVQGLHVAQLLLSFP